MSLRLQSKLRKATSGELRIELQQHLDEIEKIKGAMKKFLALNDSQTESAGGNFKMLDINVTKKEG